MNIAEAFPARRQPDGTVWYRAADLEGRLADGWTAQLCYAHPDYRAPGAPAPLDPSRVEHAALTTVADVNRDLMHPASTGHDGGPRGHTFQPEPVAASATVTTTATTTEEIHDDQKPRIQEGGSRLHGVAPRNDVHPGPQQAVGRANGGPATTQPSAPSDDGEGTAVTAIDDTGEFFDPPRFTEWMHYPLPPPLARPASKFNGWNWYLLPSPETGRPTGYPRATYVAGTLDDEFGLNKWKRRETAKRIYQLTAMDPGAVLNEHYPDTTAGAALEALVAAMGASKVTDLDNVLDAIDNLLGGAEARELGECAHAWLAAIHAGQVLMRDVPDVVRPHIAAARKVLAHRGIVVLPDYTERTVMNDQGYDPETGDGEIVCGKIDGIGRIVTTGELVGFDVKTNKDLKYSWLSFGVQVGGAYGWATKILSLDGKSWEPMPETRRDFAVLLHVPSNEPSRAQAITIDLWWGGARLQDSINARQYRKEAKTEVPKHAIPAPSDEALHYVAARQALSDITTADEGQAVYETYREVWNDDLQEFAEKIAELI